MQIIKKQVNGIEISIKVLDDKKKVWVLMDDNFALAEGYFTMRSMLSGFLFHKNERPETRTHKNNWSKVDEEGFFTVEFAKQSKMLKAIVEEIQKIKS